MERNCKNCAIKNTCLKRSMCIYLLFIQTGRINELTESVKENFCCTTDCENWCPIGGEPHEKTKSYL